MDRRELMDGQGTRSMLGTCIALDARAASGYFRAMAKKAGRKRVKPRGKIEDVPVKTRTTRKTAKATSRRRHGG